MPHWGTSSEFQRGDVRFKTRHYFISRVFYVIPFFSPLHLGTRASMRHVVCHHLAVCTDEALRLCQTMPHWGTSSEFQRGEGRFKTRHYVILHVFLRHTFLLPVEIRNSCLTEARVCHHLYWGTSSEFQRGENRENQFKTRHYVSLLAFHVMI